VLGLDARQAFIPGLCIGRAHLKKDPHKRAHFCGSRRFMEDLPKPLWGLHEQRRVHSRAGKDVEGAWWLLYGIYRLLSGSPT